jgi:hypothetical protein
MTNNSDKAAHAWENSPWLRIDQFLFFVVQSVVSFLLAQSMVHYRFFRGGLINENDTLRA